MIVRYRILGGEEKEVETKAKTVEELMKELGLSPEEYIPAFGEKVVSEKEELKEGEKITFIPVVSGG